MAGAWNIKLIVHTVFFKTNHPFETCSQRIRWKKIFIWKIRDAGNENLKHDFFVRTV